MFTRVKVMVVTNVLSRLFPARKALLGQKQALILTLLRLGEFRNEVLNGRELIKRARGELRQGTVYVTLDRMERGGLVVSEHVDRDQKGPQLRVYALTDKGIERLARYWEHRGQVDLARAVQTCDFEGIEGLEGEIG